MGYVLKNSDSKKMKDIKVLILGKKPPPIGGVTIHVSRLLEKLDDSSIEYVFIENTQNIPKLIYHIRRSCLTHVHSSCPYFRLLVVLIAKLFDSKSIITIHGDLGRFKSPLKNYIDNLTVKWCSFPVVLNQGSFKKAILLNRYTHEISAFIPPIGRSQLPRSVEDKIKELRNDHSLIFSTNAFNRTIDKNGKEIYGIEMLVPIFKMYPNYALIISDPSSAYLDYFNQQKIGIPENIYIINFPHSYFEILDKVDVSIRNTSTDGDPLSIKESLYLGVPVIASNVVSRHSDCVTYQRDQLDSQFSDLIQILKTTSIKNAIEDGSIEIFDLYRELTN